MDALNQYVVITIGDGLVSSIPSVLISLATGILVTKAAKEDQDMAGMVFGQLFENARVLTIVGGVLIFLGVMTPLPIYIFIPLGIVFIMIGQNTQQKQAIREIQDETSTAEADADEIRRPENVTALLQVDPIELEFGYGIIPLADVSQGGDLLDRVVMIRRQIALEMGTVVPIIRLRDNIQLNPNQYIIKIKGVQISEGEIFIRPLYGNESGNCRRRNLRYTDL